MISFGYCTQKSTFSYDAAHFSFAGQIPDVLQELSPIKFATNRERHKELWTVECSVTPKMICSTEKHARICYVRIF